MQSSGKGCHMTHSKLQISSLVALIAIPALACMAVAQSLEDKVNSLSSNDQIWVNNSCSRTLGPSLWKRCVERELDALKSGIPSMDQLSDQDRAWVNESCARTLGPSLYRTCLIREENAIRQGMPQLNGIAERDKEWIYQSCHRSLGPALFRNCIIRESKALK